MAQSILQTYLDEQFIKTSDEANLANLQKAVAQVVKTLKAKKAKVIPYTLVAIDPLISEDDPVVVEVEKIIISKWKTFRNNVTSTKDKATTYVRAVILEGLGKLVSEPDFAAMVWHTSRDIITYYNTGSEGDTIEQLIQMVANSVEVDGQKYWDVKSRPNIGHFEGSEINITGVAATNIDQQVLEAHLKAAAVHSGWSAQAGGGENPQTQGRNDYTWPKFFAERAAKGIAEQLNGSLASQNKALNSISSSLQKELSKYFSELQPFFEKISHTIIEGVIANNNRSELLWWKQAHQ